MSGDNVLPKGGRLKIKLSGSPLPFIKGGLLLLLAPFLWTDNKVLLAMCALTILFGGIPIFPGSILHEWAHKKMCDLRGLEVLTCEYFSIGPVCGTVAHKGAGTAMDELLIGMAPILFLPWISIAVLTVAKFTTGLLYLFLAWLGISIAMASLPSIGDSKPFEQMKKREMFMRSMFSSESFEPDPPRITSMLLIGHLVWLDAFVALAFMFVASRLVLLL